ncbi:hypothetical protein BS47DRAFT_1363935 [Hydnum rufescens UP504]|uniref:Uncharacterized protein n=1 Tax=Hydnum rufescens UP504 TaxID=1448309 RepID=A0A9P6ATB6_9AGAM|nr:hypothetical protein BS47DRAFT_1363935 [Hydnum rufescens UP504]
MNPKKAIIYQQLENCLDVYISSDTKEFDAIPIADNNKWIEVFHHFPRRLKNDFICTPLLVTSKEENGEGNGEEGISEKGNSKKGNSEKGNSEKGKSEKGNSEKGNSRKGNGKKGNGSDEENGSRKEASDARGNKNETDGKGNEEMPNNRGSNTKHGGNHPENIIVNHTHHWGGAVHLMLALSDQDHQKDALVGICISCQCQTQAFSIWATIGSPQLHNCSLEVSLGRLPVVHFPLLLPLGTLKNFSNLRLCSTISTFARGLLTWGPIGPNTPYQPDQVGPQWGPQSLNFMPATCTNLYIYLWQG